MRKRLPTTAIIVACCLLAQIALLLYTTNLTSKHFVTVEQLQPQSLQNHHERDHTAESVEILMTDSQHNDSVIELSELKRLEALNFPAGLVPLSVIANHMKNKINVLDRELAVNTHGETLVELQLLSGGSADFEDEVNTIALFPISLHVSTYQLRKTVSSLCGQTRKLFEVWLFFVAGGTPDEIRILRPLGLGGNILLSGSFPECQRHNIPVKQWLVQEESQWMYAVLQVRTSHVWIITSPVIPGEQYHQLLVSTLSISTFESAIIGSHSIQFDTKNQSQYPIVLPSGSPHSLPNHFIEVQLIYGAIFCKTDAIRTATASYLINRQDNLLVTVMNEVLPTLNNEVAACLLDGMRLNAAHWIYGTSGKEQTWLGLLPCDRTRPETWSATTDNSISATFQKLMHSYVLYQPAERWLASLAGMGIRFEEPRDDHVAIVTSYEPSDVLAHHLQQPYNFFKKMRSFGHRAIFIVLSSLSHKEVVRDLNADVKLSEFFTFSSKKTFQLFLQRVKPALAFSISEWPHESYGKIEAPTLISVNAEEWRFIEYFSFLDVKTLSRWHKPKLKIQIITYNRPQSLRRLCTSLHQSVFFNDEIELTFHVEANPTPETSMFVAGFSWPYGTKRLHRRIVRGGLMSAVVESWYPVDDDEYGLFLEDDIELSPLFYVWSKLSLLTYRYGEKRNPHLFGISLYTPRIQEMSFPRERINPFEATSPEGTPFLFQTPCSWGAIYFPEHWKQFHNYLAGRLIWINDVQRNVTVPTPGGIRDIFVPNSRSNFWQHSWKKYFIEMISLHAYLMLYPNFHNQTSFSTNHLEPGMHISARSKVRQMLYEFEVPLMDRFPDENKLSDNSKPSVGSLPQGRLPHWEELPVRDLLFKPTHLKMLIELGQSLQRQQANS